nr:hypothetical protein [uncultured Nitrososphaera sp.]
MTSSCIAANIEEMVKASIQRLCRNYPKYLPDEKEFMAEGLELVKNIRGETLYNGKNPRSFAAAIVYATAIWNGYHLNQVWVCQDMDIGEAALRRSWNILKNYLEKIHYKGLPREEEDD